MTRYLSFNTGWNRLIHRPQTHIFATIASSLGLWPCNVKRAPTSYWGEVMPLFHHSKHVVNAHLHLGGRMHAAACKELGWAVRICWCWRACLQEVLLLYCLWNNKKNVTLAVPMQEVQYRANADRLMLQPMILRYIGACQQLPSTGPPYLQ